MRNYYFAGLLAMYVIFGASVHAQTPNIKDRSGLYIGHSIGLAKATGDTKASTDIGGATAYFTSPDDVQIATAGAGSLSQSHLSGGVFVGHWKQYGSVHIGVEASANSLLVDESRSQVATYISAPAYHFTIMQTVMADWQGTLRLRLGYTRENWLAYITGGAAVSRVKFETSFTDTYLAPLGASSQSSTAKTKVGWALGVGAEHALTKRLAIRGEYLYADFGNIDTQSVVSNQLAPGLSSILTNSTDFRTHTLSIALMYRFQ